MTRHERNCIIKKIWNVYTPYIQMGGWLIIVCGFILTVIAAATKVEAFDDRLTANEIAIKKLETVDDKLDLVITLLKDKRR
jgi:hypothetical protein